MYVPVATNWCVTPFAILGVGGVTCTLTRVAAVTVSVVSPLIPLTVAVIVAEPTPVPVDNPGVLSPELSIVATLVDELVQEAELVKI